MRDEHTANLNLPLPHLENPLDEDVERLRAALTALDIESGDVRAVLATLSGLLESAADTATWTGVSGKPEAFPPAGHKTIHATGGADALTPADIGAQPAGDYASAGDYALSTDPRLTDARTPTAHAATHGTGGDDAITSLGPVAEKSQDLGTISGSVTIDLSAGLSVSATIGGAVTLAFMGVPIGGAAVVVLRLTNGGSSVVTWPATIAWANSTAPRLTATGTDMIVLVTDDGGASWMGSASLKYGAGA